MKRKLALLIVSFTGLLLIAGLIFLFVRKGHAATDPSDAPPDAFKLNGDSIVVNDDAARTAGIKELTLASRDLPMLLTLTGRSGLNMETVTHVHAQFGGKVINVGPELGAAVKGPDSGSPTVLCVIESNDLAQAKSAWMQAKIQVKLDQDALERTRQLVTAKVLAEKFLIDAESAATKDTASLEATRQQLMIFGLTQKEIDSIEKQVGRQRMDYVIYSPRTGVIAEKGVAGGEIADPTLNLFTIADTKTLWVWGDVYERDLPKVKVGQTIRIQFTSEPEHPQECRIDWISPVLDPNTHSVKIRGVLKNEDGRFLSDMYGTMVVTVSDGKDSLIIPADAVVREDNKAFVFVRQGKAAGKTTYRRTPVKVQPVDIGFGASDTISAVMSSAARGSTTQPSSLRVSQGLVSGEVIVISGALGLSNEMDEQAKQ